MILFTSFTFVQQFLVDCRLHLHTKNLTTAIGLELLVVGDTIGDTQVLLIGINFIDLGLK